MKATTRNLFLAAIVFVSQTANAQKKPAKLTLTQQAGWLIGTWKNKSPEGLLVEKWQKQNDSTYTGKTYFLAGKDTTFAESFVLQQRGGKLYYIPTVKNQNGGKPVKFTQTGSGLVFTNPTHDYPQKLTYKQIKPDSLVAEISGMSKGKFKSEKFPMGRAKK